MAATSVAISLGRVTELKECSAGWWMKGDWPYTPSPQGFISYSLPEFRVGGAQFPFGPQHRALGSAANVWLRVCTAPGDAATLLMDARTSPRLELPVHHVDAHLRCHWHANLCEAWLHSIPGFNVSAFRMMHPHCGNFFDMDGESDFCNTFVWNPMQMVPMGWNQGQEEEQVAEKLPAGEKTADRDVRRLGSFFGIDQSTMERLDELLERRKDSRERDLAKLYEILETARSPSRLLMAKLEEMEDGQFVTNFKRDENIDRLCEQYKLNDAARCRLVELRVRRKSTQEEDHARLQEHLKLCSDPSYTAVSLVKKVTQGRSCRTFLGQPCPVCRTYQRIGVLLLDRLVPSQEAQALNCLREAAGHLQDLAETSGRRELGVPTAPPLLSGALEGSHPSAEAPAAVKKEEEEEEGPRETAPPVAEAATEAEVKEEKEEAEEETEATTETKEEVKEEPPGEKATPDTKKNKNKDKKDKSNKDKRENKRSKRDSAGSGITRRSKEDGEIEQERVDRFVSSHPESFGLGSLPVKGSAGQALPGEGEPRHEPEAKGAIPSSLSKSTRRINDHQATEEKQIEREKEEEQGSCTS
eukprot:s406_g13.t1